MRKLKMLFEIEVEVEVEFNEARGMISESQHDVQTERKITYVRKNH